MLYRVASAFVDYFVSHQKMYKLLMGLFYSAKENEAYQAVRPMVKDIYRRIVQVFEQASNRLGNMNGRQEQFAIGFLGIINNYLLVAGEQAENTVQISDEIKISLVNQFMYGIFS